MGEDKPINEICPAHSGLATGQKIVITLLAVLIIMVYNVWSGISETKEKINTYNTVLTVELEKVKGDVEQNSRNIARIEKQISSLQK